MTNGLWLITSSAFVEQELSAEFGHLPPAFLPVGVKRLYEYQLEQLGQKKSVFLMLPESYHIPSNDFDKLQTFKAEILKIPDGLSLGDAVVFALNIIGGPDQPVSILHGDTLIENIPESSYDEIGVSKSYEGYSWAEVHLDGDKVLGLETIAAGHTNTEQRKVASGYFSFSHSSALVRGIVRSRGDFIEGIMSYAKEYTLNAIETESWLDFGHLQTFFRSRRMLASARVFNTLQIDGRVVRKLSLDKLKMKAEAEWLNNLPPQLRVYSARLIDNGEVDDKAFYETEYEYLPTLSELFVFGTLGQKQWTQILQSCCEFLSISRKISNDAPSDDVIGYLTKRKTFERLELFGLSSEFNIRQPLFYDNKPMPSLMQIASEIDKLIDIDFSQKQTVMHGDFCFSNILYSSRVQRVKVIDPRGYVRPGHYTIYGDPRYDLAKIAHSIFGRYDQIIAGRYSISFENGNNFCICFETNSHHRWLEKSWPDFLVGNVAVYSREIQAIMINLFLSMLPLHADRKDRQLAFIANALRLYSDLTSRIE